MRKTLCDHRRIRRRGTWRTLDGTNGLPGPVISLFQDRHGFLWMGTWGCGAVRYDGDTLRTYGTAEGLSGDTVWGITQDANGHIWFAATAGMSRWDGEQFQTYGVEDGLPHEQTNFVHADRQGRVWVATEDGVAVFDGQRFAALGAAQGLSLPRIQHIAEDGDGRLWFGAVGGAARGELRRGKRPDEPQKSHKPERECTCSHAPKRASQPVGRGLSHCPAFISALTASARSFFTMTG